MVVARQAGAVARALRPFLEVVTQSPVQGARPVIADFMAGNPQEPTLPGFVEALRRWSVPASTDWFAYRLMHEPARQAAAASLTAELGVCFAAEDVFLTRGAAGAITLALSTVADPGDEVVFVSPPWFFYEAMILASGATPIRVRLEPPAFDLDVDALVAALGPRTRAVIVNTPHNPTGRIYPAAALQRLAEGLAETAGRYGRPIWVISDEAYSRILFDDRSFPSPGLFHPYSMLVHTYSKSTLAPGQRLGFLALAPGLPDAEVVRRALRSVLTSGLMMPDAVMQYALPDIDGLLIDVAAIERRRDRMVAVLREQGYELHIPEATFYLLPRAPLVDDRAFCALLAEEGVIVLPGHVVELPGYFRISLTATDEMVERSFPVFARAIERARSGTPSPGTPSPGTTAGPAGR
ncbi:MAG TPA: aminotransferase class I/II-fold pyridoxal phosphate-dependent enzyme [Pseudonocardiaceae bacterium]|nr:aminotransferase class I/II-fold pyridoxal phosphate-dependent enzyme [Pseudonocardiaceae bacterium]